MTIHPKMSERVLECHGVTGLSVSTKEKHYILISDGLKSIRIVSSTLQRVILTSAQARHLAQQLLGAASRLEEASETDETLATESEESP